MINKIMDIIKNIIAAISDRGISFWLVVGLILWSTIALAITVFVGLVFYNLLSAMWFVYQDFYSMTLHDQFILIGLTIFLVKSFSPTINNEMKNDN